MCSGTSYLFRRFIHGNEEFGCTAQPGAEPFSVVAHSAMICWMDYLSAGLNLDPITGLVL